MFGAVQIVLFLYQLWSILDLRKLAPKLYDKRILPLLRLFDRRKSLYASPTLPIFYSVNKVIE